MAVLTEFFVASPSEVAAMDLDEPPSRGGFEGIEEFTGIDNLMTAGLGSLLIGDDDRLLDQIVAASDDPDGPFLWQLRPEAVTMLSQAPPSSLPELAASWSAMEEFFGATPADVLPVVQGLHRLAQRATADSKLVYGWLST